MDKRLNIKDVISALGFMPMALSRLYSVLFAGRTVVTSPIVMLDNDRIVNVNLTVPADVVVTGATNRTVWRPYTIKDAAGNANVHNITYTPAVGNIDGAATAIISTAYGKLTCVFDGVNEFTM